MNNKMKRLIYSLIVAASILLPMSVFASHNFITNVHKEFDVNRGCTFEILNRNGNITIENTFDDHITIDAYIVGKARSTSESEKICSKIQVSIEMADNKVTAKSEIPSSLKPSDFELNYVVVMPSYLDLNLMNKYGNVTIGELLGKTSVKVSYGTLKIDRIDDKTNSFPVIDLAYSRQSSIGEINVGGINMSYSDIAVGRGHAIAVSSKYSSLSIDKTASAAIESGYDNINIGSVVKLDLSTKYSKVGIDNVMTMSRIDLSYGSLAISDIDDGFSNIDVSTKYANVDIGIGKASSCTLDLKVKYGEINYPKPISDIKYESTPTYKSLAGKYGNPSDNKIIKVRTQYGNISIDN